MVAMRIYVVRRVGVLLMLTKYLPRIVIIGSVALLLGCAVPVDPRTNATGTVDRDGVVVPFSKPKELLLAGLVDDGLGLAIKNRYFEAESRLRQARYLEPQNERVLFNLALVLNQTSQSEEAEVLLTELNARKPGVPNTLFALADTKAALYKFDEAIGYLKEIFKLLKKVKNTGRMAQVARSISNLAFRAGNEFEALCYSYEAYQLAPSAEQLGYHGRMLVALGLYESALQFIDRETKADPTFGKRAAVKHALALSRFVTGDTKGALEAENQALDFVSKEPELGGEINAAWYVIRQANITGEESEKELEVLEDSKVAALDFREVGTEFRLFLPGNILAEIDNIPSEE